MTVADDIVQGARTVLIDAGILPAPALVYDTLRDNPESPMPDRAAALTWYPVARDHTHGLQVRCRGTRGRAREAAALANEIRLALHGLSDLTWGDTDIVHVSWVSGARLGRDANGRDEVSANFQVITSDQSTSLVD